METSIDTTDTKDEINEINLMPLVYGRSHDVLAINEKAVWCASRNHVFPAESASSQHLPVLRSTVRTVPRSGSYAIYASRPDQTRYITRAGLFNVPAAINSSTINNSTSYGTSDQYLIVHPVLNRGRVDQDNRNRSAIPQRAKQAAEEWRLDRSSRYLHPRTGCFASKA